MPPAMVAGGAAPGLRRGPSAHRDSSVAGSEALKPQRDRRPPRQPRGRSEALEPQRDRRSPRQPRGRSEALEPQRDRPPTATAPRPERSVGAAKRPSAHATAPRPERSVGAQRDRAMMAGTKCWPHEATQALLNTGTPGSPEHRQILSDRPDDWSITTFGAKWQLILLLHQDKPPLRPFASQ